MIGNNDWLDYLAHSFKGTTWGDHKYIAIKNGRYIYPEDKKTTSRYKWSARKSVPTYYNRNARDSERRNAQRQSSQNRAATNLRVEQQKRTRSIEQSRRDAERSSQIGRGLNDAFIANRNLNSRYNASAAERRDADRQAAAGKAATDYAIEQRKADERPKNLFDQMGHKITSGVNAAGNALNNAGKAVSNAAQNVGNAVGSLGNNVHDVTSGISNAFNNTVGNAASNAAQNVSNWIDTNITGNSARKEAEQRRSQAEAENRRAYEWRQQAEDEARRGDSPYFDKDAHYGSANQYFTKGAGGGVADYTSADRAAARARDLNEEANYLQNLADNSIVGRAQNAAGNAASAARNLFDEGGRRISGLVQNPAESAGTAFQNARGTLSRTGEGIVDTWNNGTEALGRGAQNAADAVGTALQNARGTLARAGEGVVDAWNNGTEAIERGVRNGIENAGNAINDTFQNARGTLSRAGEGVVDAWNNGTEAIGNIPNQIANATGVSARRGLNSAIDNEADKLRAANNAKRMHRDVLPGVANQNADELTETAKEFARQRIAAESRGDTQAASEWRARERQATEQAAMWRATAADTNLRDYYHQGAINAAQDHRQSQYDLLNAQNAYNSTPLGQIQSTLNSLGVAPEAIENYLRRWR